MTTAKQDELATETTIAGELVKIRPIGSDDLKIESDFVERMSPTSRHFRFLGGLGSLPESELKELCDIDYENRMAFIATVVKDGEEQEIAVARYVRDADGGACESAVTVADEWQHHGLGKAMMNKLIEYSRSNGEKALYSIDLANNSYMHKLANDLGMSAKRDPDDAKQMIYRLAL